jgi:hypothetical protein
MNSIPFRQGLWESFPTKTVGKISDKVCGNLCLNSSSFRQSLWETHVGGSLLGPPLIYIGSSVPVAQPVAPQQWGSRGGERGGEGREVVGGGQGAPHSRPPP